jgi:hypothetical protein
MVAMVSSVRTACLRFGPRLPLAALLIAAGLLVPAGVSRGQEQNQEGMQQAAQESPRQGMVFDVLRDGSKIGEHRLDFEHLDDTLKVSVETDLSVSFAFLTLFRYEHKRVERWRGGQLESLAGMTNDDGKEYEVSIVLKAGHYSRTVNGTEEEIAGPVAIDSLWSRDLLTGGKLFSAVSDKVYRVRSDLMGWETIQATDGPVEAEHYKLSGELDRDLWYARSGELLRVKYETPDGETYEYVRR